VDIIPSRSLVLVFAVALVACRHAAPETIPSPVAQLHPTIIDDWPNGDPSYERLAVQFNNEPLIILTQSSERPVKYHGLVITIDRIKTVRALRAAEARERFKDQSLTGAILIELK
jgi:hypothetical protein